MTNDVISSFPIPISLHDLERDPYNLLPYPYDFKDDDEATRADSFLALVEQLNLGNQAIFSADISIFQLRRENGETDWMDEDRVQALYTLIRKSTSLAPLTRKAIANALSDSVDYLSKILERNSSKECCETVPQSFRDAFACHIYMLYSFMFLLESDAKGNTKVPDEILQIRQIAAESMVKAAETMACYPSTLWQRGVPDEAVVLLPCRIAYPMLELATGVMARKASCSDQALRMIAVTLNANESALGTVVAALMDLMHSFEHMASLTAELCTMVIEEPSNRLAVELVREFGRLDGLGGKAVGIKNVAPFISDLASHRPRLVLSNISHILSQLNSEPYNLRSCIVTAISHILEFLAKHQDTFNRNQADGSESEHVSPPVNGSKSQEALLQILSDRAHDSSSYTRAATMKAWARLAESRSIPKDRILDVTRIAIDRLEDKTVVVRKSAMQLLTNLLENNPFMGNLDPEPYRKKLRELYEFVRSNLPDNIREMRDSALAQADDGETSAIEGTTLAGAITEADNLLNDGAEDLTDGQKEYCRKVQALKFTQAALCFIDLYEQATLALEGMLLSANTSDVTEALRFFVQARHFKLPCAISGMKRALALMWSSEQAIRDEVLKAFVDVFIALPGSEGKQLLSDKDIAFNLLALAEQSSLSDLASIEEAIVNLVKEKRLPANVFKILWSLASKNRDARATSIQLLAMGAAADRTIIDSKSRLKILLDEGLCERTLLGNDWKLACAVSVCLQRIGRAVVDPADAKFLVLEHIVDELCKIVSGDSCQDDNESDTLQWFSAAEQALKALFVICPEPESICKSIIVTMSATTFSEIGGAVHSHRLARFFHVLGAIALNLLVYSEALIGSVRRANGKKSLKKQEEADKAKSKKKSPAPGASPSEDEDAMESELGMAAEAEAEHERKLVDISENEILGRGQLSQFVPLLVRVVGNDCGNFHSQILSQSSTLALCKFMCVSSSFCDKHLPLLFIALMNAPPGDITMRANTVVALGDIAFRFPNEFEPYTPRLYACLRDSSTKVRRHTLMVLTHLILNDMVKVKGQVCEIAMCLRDDDQRIRDMSRLLFHELSKRSNNPIYNLLPDIISQLSHLSIRKEDFRQIMSILLSYIKKERQFEMLTEKLCQRFPTCSSISQKADLAYCISQIKMTEKCIKCLSDNFKLYKDSLFDEDIMKSFVGIVIKAKKFMKPEMKEFIEEWESKLNEFNNLGVENQQANEKASMALRKAPRGIIRKPKKRVIKIAEAKSDNAGNFTDDEAEKENEFLNLSRDDIKTR